MCVLWSATPARAAKEYREINWAWTVYAGTFGDYDTPEAVVAAWNARQEQLYTIAAGQNCGQAAKTIYELAPIENGLGPLYNGQRSFRSTYHGVQTVFYAACTSNGYTRPAMGPYVTAVDGGIGVSAKLLCPSAANNWGPETRPLGSVVLGGQTVASNRVTCVKSLPEPTGMCRGNPIDAIARSKLALDTDYSSADGRLAVRRHYSSDAARWSWDYSRSLTDFTGRGLGLPVNVSFSVKRVPSGFYDSPASVPPAEDTSRSFRLVKTEPDTGQQEVVIYDERGRRRTFVEGPAGVFTEANSVVKSVLTLGADSSGASQWIRRYPEGKFEVFDSSGALVRLVERDGKSVAFSRIGSTLTVTSMPGQRMLVYSRTNPDTPASFYDQVTLPDQSQLAYAYAGFGQVAGVVFAEGSQRQYRYDEAGQLNISSIGSPSLPGWLTGLIDENGVRIGTYSYEPGAAVATEGAGGVNRYAFTYYTSYTAVTPPNGGPATSIWWDVGPDTERRLTSQSQPAGAGCAAASSLLSYDTNGNVASRNDFNNLRVCYAYDLARNTETTRVEGLSASASCPSYTPNGSTLPPGARKVSSAWHPDWRLQVKVVEPGRITSYVYNGQPDPFAGGATASCAPSTALLPDGKPIAVLCRQVEQATTDANGSQGFAATLDAAVPNREQKWTYNAYGQVLTHDGPRTDMRDVTTYAYYTDTSFTGTGSAAVGHTLGDLQSITNAAGQVTRFTQYDKHGQLLESVDPNGVLTVNTYDLRQRLRSTSVGGKTTRYDYDLAGQLLKVTRPDASYIGYEYDPAHRQTAVFDDQGNRIEYELDNAGNRIAEKIQDTSGVLRRQLTRSIDALGRVQQTTGRE